MNMLSCSVLCCAVVCCAVLCRAVVLQAIDLLCQQYTLSDKQLVHNAMHALSGNRLQMQKGERHWNTCAPWQRLVLRL